MTETWKQIPFAEVYEVSDLGRIRNKNTGNVRSLKVRDKRNYITLIVEDKYLAFTVSKLVLSSFVRLPETNEYSYHKNGKRIDDRLENLEWSSGACSYGNHVPNSNPLVISKIGVDEDMEFNSARDVAEYIGIHRQIVYDNIGKSTHGFRIEKIPKTKPQTGYQIVELMFGSKKVYVSADCMVRSENEDWRFGNFDKSTGYIRTTFQFTDKGAVKRTPDGSIKSVKHYMHRLIATAFHGPPKNESDIVDHIDEDKTNNHPSNLQWVSRSVNGKLYFINGGKAPNSKKVDKLSRDGEFIETFDSGAAAARTLGLNSGSAISTSIKNGTPCQGFLWRKHVD